MRKNHATQKGVRFLLRFRGRHSACRLPEFCDQPIMERREVPLRTLVAWIGQVIFVVRFNLLRKRCYKLPVIQLIAQHPEPTQREALVAHASLNDVMIIVESELSASARRFQTEVNCPGFSGEQSAKQTSRKLEGRDPCRRESTARSNQPNSAYAEFGRSRKTVPIVPATALPTP